MNRAAEKELSATLFVQRPYHKTWPGIGIFLTLARMVEQTGVDGIYFVRPEPGSNLRNSAAR
jgi:hypothetical protein